MKKVKTLYLSAILSIITILSVWFIVLDFSRFFNQDYSYDIFPSAVLKRICVILAAVIAWSVGKDGLNPRDTKMIRAAFLFACLGEAAFIINERILGISMFAVCQTMLIIRNGIGFSYKLVNASRRQKKDLLVSAVIILLMLTVFAFTFGSEMKPGIASVVVCLYAILLSTSLWTGLAGYILQLLPVLSSRLAAAGMLCFFCCDVLVGLDVVMAVGMLWLFANSFIWIFYIPALVLLALSSYTYGRNI